MKKLSIQISTIYFTSLILLSGCGSAFEKCVEAKQDEYKKENPNENYEKLVRGRELHERECQDLRWLVQSLYKQICLVSEWLVKLKAHGLDA